MSAPTLAGDWNDDDGKVIDSLLDENTDGAKTPPPSTVPFVPAGETPKVSTRILGTRTVLTAGGPPQQVLWPDPDRKSLHLHCVATAVTDQVRYSSDPNLLNSDMGSPSLTQATPIDGMLHTGALYLMAVQTDATVDVTAITV